MANHALPLMVCVLTVSQGGVAHDVTVLAPLITMERAVQKSVLNASMVILVTLEQEIVGSVTLDGLDQGVSVSVRVHLSLGFVYLYLLSYPT